MEIIPAIDIIDGKCVRLTEGDYTTQKVYHEHPLDVARQFEDAGLKRLHLVDLDGAKAGAVKNWKVLEQLATRTGLAIDFGGGVKSIDEVHRVMNAGAAWVTVGSVAVKDRAAFFSWIQEYGADKFLLGADVKDEKIVVSGWLESTDIGILDFIEGYVQQGVSQIFCTDVSKDGRLEGPSVELYRRILARFPFLHLIASGGVACLNDLEALKQIGCRGVIIGKALYEGRIRLEQLTPFND